MPLRTNKLRGPQSLSELYRLTTATCRGNLVPTFVDRGVSRGQRGGSLTVVNLSFLDRVVIRKTTPKYNICNLVI
jgi:hypothetical protein